ncbi:MAG: potassium channel family protein [Myxococcota bacterium]
MALWDRLIAAHHRPHTSTYQWVQGTLTTLAVISVVTLAIELALREPDPRLVWLAWVDRFILAVFAVDVAIHLATYQPPELRVFRGSVAWRWRVHVLGRLRFLFTPMMLLDVITVASLVPALRGLRALRLLRALQGLRIFKYSNPVLEILRSFSDSWILYVSTFGFLVVTVVMGGISFYLIESGLNPSIQSIADAIWWALVTVTTVGFGDIAPATAGGRLVGSAVMVAGMFTLALFAGVVSTTLLNVMFRLREEQFRMSNHVNHVVVCGYHADARMLLDAILAETEADRPELILFADAERPPGVPPEFRWVKGDPTKENELDKVRLAFASSVIIVGDRSRSIQQADASTILTIFTIRSYLAQRREVQRRDRPVHIVAEILDHENRAHAVTAGADEVIETARLGFALMAHSVAARGSGQILAAVASAGAVSMFIGRAAVAERFGALAAAMKNKYGATTIGIRDAATGAIEFSPPDDRDVAVGAGIVYLAPAAVLEPM